MSKYEDTVGQIIALLVFILIYLSVSALWALHVYGDWTCAFAHCVKVKS